MVSCRNYDCVSFAVSNNGCPNFDCDWAVVEVPDEGPEPYIANAQFHLDILKQIINDALIGVNDECLKESLLDEIVTIEINLSKALL